MESKWLCVSRIQPNGRWTSAEPPHPHVGAELQLRLPGPPKHIHKENHLNGAGAGHDDLVMALALAGWWAYENRARALSGPETKLLD